MSLVSYMGIVADLEISVRFGGKIWKFAKLGRSVAAFRTALLGFRFLLENTESIGPNVISHYGRPIDCLDSFSPGTSVIRLACLFPITGVAGQSIEDVRTSISQFR